MSNFLNEEKFEISLWDDKLFIEEREGENEDGLNHNYSFYKEYKLATISANDMDSKYAAFNATFVEKTSGEKTLTFSIYYQLLDEDEGVYKENPFVPWLTNERKVKLFYRNKWYDFLIKNCQENSATHTFTYTAKELYVNELAKNGFNIEMDTELENNQGTIIYLGKRILEGTDWEIDEENSDIIVQTKVEPLYKGIINRDLILKAMVNYMPNPNELYSKEEFEKKRNLVVKKGTEVYLFYSDLVEENPHPNILFNEKGYKTDINDDIITNAYNYLIVNVKNNDYIANKDLVEIEYESYEENDNVPDFIDPTTLELSNGYRGQKVVRSPLTGYDPDIDKYITKFIKTAEIGEDGKIYNGYIKTRSLSADLAQNYLSNSEDFTGLESGWIFDGTPSTIDDQGSAVIAQEDASFTGEVFIQNGRTFYDVEGNQVNDSVLVLSLKNEHGYYHSSNGEYIKVKARVKAGEKLEDYVEVEKFVRIGSIEAINFEQNIYKDLLQKREQANSITEEDPAWTEVKQYKDKTDKELLNMAKCAVTNLRYSKRKKQALNTGVATNRQVIEGFTEGEDYALALSLGKYTEYKDDEGNVYYPEDSSPPADYPESKNQEIQYGYVTPGISYDFQKVDEGSGNYALDAWMKVAQDKQIHWQNSESDDPEEDFTYDELTNGWESLEPSFNKELKQQYVNLLFEEWDKAPERALEYLKFINPDVEPGGVEYTRRIFQMLLQEMSDADEALLAKKEAYDSAKYELEQDGLKDIESVLGGNSSDTAPYEGFNYSKYFKYDEDQGRKDKVRELIQFRTNQPLAVIRVEEEKYPLGDLKDRHITEIPAGSLILAFSDDYFISSDEENVPNCPYIRFFYRSDGQYKNQHGELIDEAGYNNELWDYVNFILAKNKEIEDLQKDWWLDGWYNTPSERRKAEQIRQQIKERSIAFKNMVETKYTIANSYCYSVVSPFVSYYKKSFNAELNGEPMTLEYYIPSIASVDSGIHYSTKGAYINYENVVGFYADKNEDFKAEIYEIIINHYGEYTKFVTKYSQGTTILEEVHVGLINQYIDKLIEWLDAKLQMNQTFQTMMVMLNNGKYKLDQLIKESPNNYTGSDWYSCSIDYLSQLLLHYVYASRTATSKFEEMHGKDFMTKEETSFLFHLKVSDQRRNEYLGDLATGSYVLQEGRYDKVTYNKVDSMKNGDYYKLVEKTDLNTADSIVYDFEEKIWRLINRETEIQRSLYIAYDDENGKYVYDGITNRYRRYDEKRDNIEHDITLFDGHLGKWTEIPPRYSFKRTYINPDAREYDEKTGQQLYFAYENAKGEFVLASEVKKSLWERIKEWFGEMIQVLTNQAIETNLEVTEWGKNVDEWLKQFGIEITNLFSDLKITPVVSSSQAVSVNPQTRSGEYTLGQTIKTIWGYVVTIYDYISEEWKDLQTELGQVETVEDIVKLIGKLIDAPEGYTSGWINGWEWLRGELEAFGDYAEERRKEIISLLKNELTIGLLTNIFSKYGFQNMGISTENLYFNDKENKWVENDFMYYCRARLASKDFVETDRGDFILDTSNKILPSESDRAEAAMYKAIHEANQYRMDANYDDLEDWWCGSQEFQFKFLNLYKLEISKYDNQEENITEQTKRETIANLRDLAFDETNVKEISVQGLIKLSVDETNYTKTAQSGLEYLYLLVEQYEYYYNLYSKGWFIDLFTKNGKEKPEVTDEDEFYSDSGATDDVDPWETTDAFVQYRWWNYRHWGVRRWSFKPFLCTHSLKGEEDEYWVYNNKRDAKPQAYKVIFEGTKEDFRVAGINLSDYKDENHALLRVRDEIYGVVQEQDYEIKRYTPQLAEEMIEGKYVYDVEYNYYRPYNKKERSIVLFDGHLGKWVQCYDFISNNNGAWMKNNDLFIPFNEEKFGKRDRYIFKSVSGEGRFLLYEGQYISRDLYYEKFLSKLKLNYDYLQVAFCDKYEYDAENFALKVDFENKEGNLINHLNDYLTFNCSESPSGHFCSQTGSESLIIGDSTGIEELKGKTVTRYDKEKWVYWKTKVKKSISLTEDLLAKIGMLFYTNIPYNNTTDPNGKRGLSSSSEIIQKNDPVNYITNGKDYVFLGIQLFKCYDYQDKIEYEEEGKTKYRYEKKMVIPGQAPETEDYICTEYYIYDEDKVDDVLGAVYEYVGTEPFENGWEYYYDETYSKVRSIKGKESTYLELLQTLNKTFECWADFIIEHDEYGRVIYKNRVVLEEPRQTQTDLNSSSAINNTSQIYVLKEKKMTVNEEEKTVYYIPESYKYLRFSTNQEQGVEIIDNKYLLIDNSTLTKKIKVIFEKKYQVNYVDDEVSFEKEEKTFIKELEFMIKLIKTPSKKIRFKQYVGKENHAGFKFGVNLNSIQRTLNSDQTISKLIVKPNNNEFGKDGFCSAQRATENFIKENFIYDFDYYIKHGMLDFNEITNDLYSLTATNLGYYLKLSRINKKLNSLVEEIAAVKKDLDKVNAQYETYHFAQEAAKEEIRKIVEILSSNYSQYGQLVDSPWTYNKSKRYNGKRGAITIGYDKELTTTNELGEVITYTVQVEKQQTETLYPAYNEQLRSYFDQMDVLQSKYKDYTLKLNDIRKSKNEREARLHELLIEDDEMIRKKEQLNKLFYHKYSRFIQEGSWTSDKYIDDNLYYLDALSVARNSIFPKVSYQINVTDYYPLKDYNIFDFSIGDRTYIEDTEFFGYATEGKPYHEEVIVSEFVHVLDNPAKNVIKVQNFRTQYDDMFKRISAAVKNLEFNKGSYGFSSSFLNPDGTIKKDKLQASVDNASLVLSGARNQLVVSDDTGITVSSQTSKDYGVLKIINSGIYISGDGSHYTLAIDHRGINASAIIAGRLDVDRILIGCSTTPNFLWDKLGISAFATDKQGKVSYHKLVRFDQYGIYGTDIAGEDGAIIEQIDNLGNDRIFNPQAHDSGEENVYSYIKRMCRFGLTWEGFFFKSGNNQSQGMVTFDSGNDFKMLSRRDGEWKEQVVIGKLKNLSGQEYYGFRLLDSYGAAVMETNQEGELYLKKKLRISNFKEPVYINQGIDSSHSVHGETERFATSANLYEPEDRVTLGIVETYERQYDTRGNLIKYALQTGLSGAYSSANYLTKIMSIKINEKVNLKNNKYETWSDETMKSLVADNETFAIFDNGNLYAKNAWLEGHIRATSGNIIGVLYVGDKTKEDPGIVIDGEMGEIRTSNYKEDSQTQDSIGWRITKDKAFLQGAVFSGNVTILGDSDKNSLMGQLRVGNIILNGYQDLNAQAQPIGSPEEPGGASIYTLDYLGEKNDSGEFITPPGQKGWYIGENYVVFERGKFRGKLFDTIIETSTVQTVGGSLLVAKSASILNHRIIDLNNPPKDFQEDDNLSYVLQGIQSQNSELQFLLEILIEDNNVLDREAVLGEDKIRYKNLFCYFGNTEARNSIPDDQINTASYYQAINLIEYTDGKFQMKKLPSYKISREEVDGEGNIVEQEIELAEEGTEDAVQYWDNVHYQANAGIPIEEIEFSDLETAAENHPLEEGKRGYIKLVFAFQGSKEDGIYKEFVLSEKTPNSMILMYDGESGISINATNYTEKDGLLNAKSFSLFDYKINTSDSLLGNSIERVPRAVLGKIPMEETYGVIKGRTGLYAENALIKGSLILQDDYNFSGFSTTEGYYNLIGLNEGERRRPLIWVVNTPEFISREQAEIRGLTFGEYKYVWDVDEQRYVEAEEGLGTHAHRDSPFNKIDSETKIEYKDYYTSLNTTDCLFWLDDTGTLYATQATIKNSAIIGSYLSFDLEKERGETASIELNSTKNYYRGNIDISPHQELYSFLNSDYGDNLELPGLDIKIKTTSEMPDRDYTGLSLYIPSFSDSAGVRKQTGDKLIYTVSKSLFFCRSQNMIFSPFEENSGVINAEKYYLNSIVFKDEEEKIGANSIYYKYISSSKLVLSRGLTLLNKNENNQGKSFEIYNNYIGLIKTSAEKNEDLTGFSFQEEQIELHTEEIKWGENINVEKIKNGNEVIGFDLYVD